jgi:hypothetical protein
MVIRFPPSAELDTLASSAKYDLFRKVATHTDEDIVQFESRHRKVLEQRMMKQASVIKEQKQAEEGVKTLSDYGPLKFENGDHKEDVEHTPLPPDTGKITHLSLACLYGAIVCKVLSTQAYDDRSLYKLLAQKEKTAARAICVFFGGQHVDERMRKDWISWNKIIRDVDREGLGAAINKNQTVLEDGKKVKLSRKEIKKMEPIVRQKIRDLNTYVPVFLDLFPAFGDQIKNDPVNAARFLDNFSKLESSVYDQKITYRYAWIVHGKDDRCPIPPDESPRIVKMEKEKK